MKLKKLKQILNKLPDNELNKELLFMSEEYSLSGIVSDIKKAKQNLYTTHEDDPSPLYTLKQLREQGLDKEGIDSADIEIPKGSFILKF